MNVTVEIPTAFRHFTAGACKLDCQAATLTELLGELESRFPAMARHLRDESGRVRRFLNIYVNEEDVRFLGGESYSFREGDRVMLVPSIAGG
jgi:molybdopterin synthase sulfur carrier subunit